jgi:very-short-patch-repair endonuclease
MKRAQAKQLRSQQTDAETRLWYFLRAHRFGGFKFKRQAPIGPYIVDFICFEHRLIVEVDGGQHAENGSDQRRDSWLGSEGYKVMRFWNNDVLKRTDVVLGEIANALMSTPLPARHSASQTRVNPLMARHPLPQGERGPQRRD